MWLRIKVIAAFVACISIPLLAGLGVVAIGSRYALERSATNDLQDATNSALKILEERIAQNLAHLRAWSAFPVMQDVLIADNGGDVARVLTNLKANYPDFAALTVTDARGAVIAATEQSELKSDLSGDEGFRASASGRLYQSLFGFRTASAPETIWFTVPVIANYDRQTVIGTLTGVLDFKAVAKAATGQSALAASAATSSRNFVVERLDDGGIVYASKPDANLFRALQQGENRHTDEPSQIAWNDETYFTATASSKGKSLLHDPGLVVRGIEPGRAIFAAADNLTLVFGIVGGAAVALSLYLAWMWSTPLTQVASLMVRLARGDTKWQLPSIAPHHAFAQMSRSLEVFRQTKLVRDHVASREQELHRAKGDAEAAALAKSQHLASLSRELRTQLNTIIGLSELINRENLEAAGKPQHASYAKDIARSGVQLLAVINDLFDLSEAEAGQLTLDETDADLSELVRDSVELLRDAAQKAKITLSGEGCDAPVMARIDTHKFKQILFNLLSNAVKFTLEDGRVDVRLKIASDGRPTIVVEDNGIGMPSNLTPVALTPFSPAGDGSAHGRHGAGLGLPLVRRLVDLHQGTVEIESEVGKGTTVTIALPASRLVVQTNETEERLIA